MYAIFHMQHEKGTWYWVVHYSRCGKRNYRRFYEPKYGGSAKALKAAKTWRDEQLAKVKVLTLVEFCQRKRSNNTSGVPGVHYLVTARQPEGIWQAKLRLDGGKSKSKSFSVHRHGNHAAYELAVAAREQLLANAKDRPYLYNRVAKRLAPMASSRSINSMPRG